MTLLENWTKFKNMQLLPRYVKLCLSGQYVSLTSRRNQINAFSLLKIFKERAECSQGFYASHM